MTKTALATALGALMLTACSGRVTSTKTEQTKPMTQIDSVSYAIGVINAELFDRSLAGFPGDSLHKETILKGFSDNFLGQSPKMRTEDARAVIEGYVRSVAERAEQEARKGNEAYLTSYAEGAGTQRTESGLMWRELRPGKGEHPTAADTVVVHYIGRTTDGKEFDNSYRRQQPARLHLGQVIKGWTEGIALMTPGAKYELCIPPELGYGSRGAGSAIPPHAILLFEVELLEVIKAQPQEAKD